MTTSIDTSDLKRRMHGAIEALKHDLGGLRTGRASVALVDGIQVEKSTMADRVKSKLEDKSERIVLIKGDQDASYSAIMAAMDDLRKVGIEDIGLITERKAKPAATAGGK